MSARWRLPDALGGGEYEALTSFNSKAGDDWRVRFSIPDVGLVDVPMEALTEVKPPLPPEPPVGAYRIEGVPSFTRSRLCMRVSSKPGMGWVYQTDDEMFAEMTFAELCGDFGTNFVPLVEAPKPVTLPWELRSGHRYIHVRADPGLDEEDDRLPGSAFVEVRDDDGNATAEIWLTSDARRQLIAALSAVDAAEATP